MLIFSLLKDKKMTRLKSPRQIWIWKIHSSKDSYALCTGSLYSFLFSFHLPPLPNTLLILSSSLNIYTTLSWLLPHQWIAFFQSSSLKNTPRKCCLGKFPPQENSFLCKLLNKFGNSFTPLSKSIESHSLLSKSYSMRYAWNWICVTCVNLITIFPNDTNLPFCMYIFDYLPNISTKHKFSVNIHLILNQTQLYFDNKIRKIQLCPSRWFWKSMKFCRSMGKLHACILFPFIIFRL